MADKFVLPNNLRGRSLHAKVIPTVCNLDMAGWQGRRRVFRNTE